MITSKTPIWSTNTINTKDFIKEFRINEGTFVDKSFQRRSCWSVDRQRKYVTAMYDRLNSTPVVVAEISTGIEAEKQYSANSFGGRRAYEKAMKGSTAFQNKYVSLDGLQRTTAIEGFFNNEFTISGNFVDDSGNEHIVDNEFYKDMPDSLRTVFLNTSVQVTVHRYTRYNTLSKLFFGLNDGEPLNYTEKRNSIQTPVSTWIRNNSSEQAKFSRLWNYIYPPEKISRMHDIDMLTGISMWLIGNYNTDGNVSSISNPAGKDRWYSLGIGHAEMTSTEKPSSSPYIKEEFDRVVDILEMLQEVIINQKQRDQGKVPIQSLYSLVFSLEWLYDNGYYIQKHDSDKFYGKLLNWYSQKHRDDEHRKSKAEMKWIKKNPSNANKVGDFVNKYDYFHYYSKTPNNSLSRKALIKDVTSWIKKEIESLPVTSKPANAHANVA